MNSSFESSDIISAGVDDVFGISEVQKAVWLTTFPNEEYSITREDVLSEDFFNPATLQARGQVIADPNAKTKFWVAKANDRVIGYCCAERCEAYNYLRSLYILTEFQGRGIGKQLIKKAFDYFDSTKPVRLTVAVYSTQAIAFYEKLGFVKGKRLARNPEGPFPSGAEVPDMEMWRLV